MTNINLNNLIQEAKMWNTQILTLESTLITLTDAHMINSYKKTIADTKNILTPLKLRYLFFIQTMSAQK